MNNDETIELLLEIRRFFRDNKEWSFADKIRKGLEDAGIVLCDCEDGSVFWKMK